MTAHPFVTCSTESDPARDARFKCAHVRADRSLHMFDDTRGIDEALAAILWVGVALLVANAVCAWRLGRVNARTSVRGFGLGFITVVCAEIATVVVWRAVGGEMTGFDALWLLGVVAVGTASALGLRRHRLR